MIKLYNYAITQLGNTNPFRMKISLARSILALSLILTLVFNSSTVLFPMYSFDISSSHMLFNYNFYSLFGYKFLFISKIISIVILVFVIIGYYPRITGILHFWLSYSFVTIAPIVDGGDNIASNLTFLIMFFLFFDNRKNHWQTKLELKKYIFNYRYFIGNTIIFLISLQIAVIYAHAGFGKLLVEEWRTGSAVYYYFNGDLFGGGYLKSLLIPYFSYPLVSAMFTWGTIILEIILSAQLFINNRIINKAFFKIAVLFHFSIIIAFGLGSFFLSMLSGIIIYLLHEEDIVAFKNKVIFITSKIYQK